MKTCFGERWLQQGFRPSRSQMGWPGHTGATRQFGLTQLWWWEGHSAPWDEMVIDSVTPSYVTMSSTCSAFATETVVQQKHCKYAKLSETCNSSHWLLKQQVPSIEMASCLNLAIVPLPLLMTLRENLVPIPAPLSCSAALQCCLFCQRIWPWSIYQKPAEVHLGLFVSVFISISRPWEQSINDKNKHSNSKFIIKMRCKSKIEIMNLILPVQMGA